MTWWLQYAGWLLIAAGTAGPIVWIWLARQCRTRVTLHRVQIEVHAATPAEDLVIETMWRVSVSMTNRSRRPRRLPLLASRATGVAGRKTYLAAVFRECAADELSPDQVVLAWAEFMLPAGVAPRLIAIAVLGGSRGPLSLRFRLHSHPARLPNVRFGGRTVRTHIAHCLAVDPEATTRLRE